MLTEIIKEVCQYSSNSTQRRKALNKLLVEIQRFSKLGRSGSIYRLDAFNQTYEYVNRNLCVKFDLNQPNVENRFIQWFNKTFYWRLRDLEHPKSKSKIKFISLDYTIEDNSNARLLDLLTKDGFNPPHRDCLDVYIEQIDKTNKEDLSNQVVNYLTEDPDRKLYSSHPRNYPQCNCQYIVEKHLLEKPSKKLSNIAKELKVNYQTLNSHWNRKCLPKLQEIAKELGYVRE